MSARGHTRGTALVLPGQGSQRVGMLGALPDFDGLQDMLMRADAASGLALRALACDGPAEALADTRVAQPLLFATDCAWGIALVEAGITPVAVAGHSLGELAALALAGVFDYPTGLSLVTQRSRLMAACARTTPGGMTAVIGLDGAVVAHAISGLQNVWLANDNCPGQVVISGTTDGLAAAAPALQEAGARKLVPLAVAGPFHSPLMRPAAEQFAHVLDGVSFADALYPVVSNAHPEACTDGATLRSRLKDQMVSPVRWTETMKALLAAGAPLIVEAGPGAVLTGMARRMEGIVGISAEERGVDGVLEEVAA